MTPTLFSLREKNCEPRWKTRGSLDAHRDGHRCFSIFNSRLQNLWYIFKSFS